MAWEASINGQVTLKPMASSLPVQNVTIDYCIKNLDDDDIPNTNCKTVLDQGWCRMATTASGKFKISFSQNDPSLNNDDKFPIQLCFSKTTSSINHCFLCNGVQDCC